MSTINNNLSLLASMLGNPKSQKPTTDQRLTQLMLEFQNLVNELTNTGKPWMTQTTVVNVSGGTEDYLVPANIGKVLFVYANRSDNVFGPFAMEFCDLASVSSDFYLFSPLDYGIARDFNEAFAVPFPAQIAFFRQGGSLYFRLPPFGTGIDSISIVSSVGDWIDALAAEDEFVVKNHAHLAVTRAAMNLLPMTEWVGDRKFNLEQRGQFAQSLQRQNESYTTAWILAKRSLVDDAPSYRVPMGGDW